LTSQGASGFHVRVLCNPARVSNARGLPTGEAPERFPEELMTNLFASEGGYQLFVLGGAEWFWLVFSMVVALLALVVGVVSMKGVLAKPTGTPEMGEIAEAVQEGAMAYITRQFRTIGIIVVPLAVIVFLTSSKVIDEGSGEGLNFAQSGGFRTLAFLVGGAGVRPRSGSSACGCPPGPTCAPPPPPRPTT
jgi:hypothetical protein